MREMCAFEARTYDSTTVEFILLLHGCICIEIRGLEIKDTWQYINIWDVIVSKNGSSEYITHKYLFPF